MSIEVGSKLEGKVTGITHFGAFVELSGGVTGLVHISEIADNYVKDVNDFLKVNDSVKVKVINVENDGKIGLSIKQAQDRPVETSKPAYTPRPKREGNRSFSNEGGSGGSGGSHRPRGRAQSFEPRGRETFDDKVSKFLKDSEDRLSSLKRNTESKRGGRGARRG